MRLAFERFDFLDANPSTTPGAGKLLSNTPEGAVYLHAADTKTYQEFLDSLMYFVDTPMGHQLCRDGSHKRYVRSYNVAHLPREETIPMPY